MKPERSDIQFPIWRKKVDKSIFEHNATTIPDWAYKMWALHELYRGVTSRKSSSSTAKLIFGKKTYSAWVTTAPHGRSSPAYRLWFEEAVGIRLKHAFLMSYMRSLEGSLTSTKDIESQIPFWEFLDIEFNRAERNFRFVAYYPVQPDFPELFKRLIGSPAIKRIDDELMGKEAHRIHKLDWKPKAELQYQLGAQNVLYMLLDESAKQVYIGEAADLVTRLRQPHPSIAGWNFFRYNVLPAALSPFRVTLERMIIRDFASVLNNKAGVPGFELTGCALCNDRIDR